MHLPLAIPSIVGDSAVQGICKISKGKMRVFHPMKPMNLLIRYRAVDFLPGTYFSLDRVVNQYGRSH